MVAVVDLAGKGREAHRQEGIGLDTFFTQAFKELVPDTPAAHIVVDDAYLDTLTSLVDKCIGHQVAQGILLHDIHTDMDMMPGPADVLQQFGEERIAVRHDVDDVVLEGQRQVLVDEEVNHLLMSLRHVQVLLFDEVQH